MAATRTWRPSRARGRAALHLGLHVRGRPPDEPVDDLLLGQRPAELAEDLGLDADREPLAVDEDAVAVEDHEPGRAAAAGPLTC